MVTWEMPDGTEFRYLGVAVSDAALREFVLRFMSAEGMSWDVSNWDDTALETAFEGFMAAFAQTLLVMGSGRGGKPKEELLKGANLAGYAGKRAKKGRSVEGLQKVAQLLGS